MIPPGLETGTLCVLGTRDNHYTTEVMIKSRSENTRNTRKIERKENRVGGLTSNKKGYLIAEGLQRVGHD